MTEIRENRGDKLKLSEPKILFSAIRWIFSSLRARIAPEALPNWRSESALSRNDKKSKKEKNLNDRNKKKQKWTIKMKAN